MAAYAWFMASVISEMRAQDRDKLQKPAYLLPYVMSTIGLDKPEARNVVEC